MIKCLIDYFLENHSKETIINILKNNKNKDNNIKELTKIIEVLNLYYKNRLNKDSCIHYLTNINNVNIDKISVNSFRLSIGPYNSLKNLQNDFNEMENLYFENLELIKQ